jgi:large subunit ribosomal protein L10
MNRAQKADNIAQLKAKADRAKITVVTDFTGMTVEEITELRVKLREAKLDYQVVKNTLARIAFTGGPHEVLGKDLKQANGVAFGYDDPVAAAKTISDFLRANPKTKLAVKFGSLDGRFLTKDALEVLAKLPGRPELLARLLGTMNAVPTGFVSVLANVLRGLLNVLTAVKDQKQEAA